MSQFITNQILFYFHVGVIPFLFTYYIFSILWPVWIYVLAAFNAGVCAFFAFCIQVYNSAGYIFFLRNGSKSVCQALIIYKSAWRKNVDQHWQLFFVHLLNSYAISFSCTVFLWLFFKKTWHSLKFNIEYLSLFLSTFVKQSYSKVH